MTDSENCCHSGQDFRDNYLIGLYDEALKKGVKLIINLDYTFGYGPSFLEESFGGLARKRKGDLFDIINIISTEEPYLIDEIKNHIKTVRESEK